MSHICPNCLALCFCNGDIDDLNLDDPEAEAKCTHYRTCKVEDAEESEDAFESEDADDTQIP